MDNYTSLDKLHVLNPYIDKRHLEEKGKTYDILPDIENISHEILRNTPRKRKTWEQWSSEETNLFFEALAMHGKNFEHIWNFMCSKRGSQMTRNKEQIRHFYYRTWAKTSKYIKYNDAQTSLKKTYIEIICLLSYGELRRRFSQVDEKKFRKILKEHLSNLIFTGSSWARFKDRRIKIKLPSREAIKNITDEEKTSKKPIKKTKNVKGPNDVSDNNKALVEVIDIFKENLSKQIGNKQKKIESWTQTVFEALEHKTNEVWKEQTDERHKMIDDFKGKLDGLYLNWEKENNILRDYIEKTEKFLQQQTQLMHQQKTVQAKNLKYFRDASQLFIKDYNEMDKNHGERKSKLMDEIKSEMDQMHEKIIAKTQHDEMNRLKSNLKKLFY